MADHLIATLKRFKATNRAGCSFTSYSFTTIVEGERCRQMKILNFSPLIYSNQSDWRYG